MGMLIYIILRRMCLDNKQNVMINLKNDVVKNIQKPDVKKIPLILALKKSGCYSFNNGKGTFSQSSMEALSAHIPHTSQNLRVDSVTQQYFVHFPSIQPTQTQVTIDPTTKIPSDDRFTGLMDHDKWIAL